MYASGEAPSRSALIEGIGPLGADVTVAPERRFVPIAVAPAGSSDVAPDSYPVGLRVWQLLNRSPSLDQTAGLFPVRFGQGGPHAADRSTSSIGTLLPIELCGRSSL